MFTIMTTKIANIRIKQKIMLLFFIGIFIPTIVLLLAVIMQVEDEFDKREQAVIEGELTRLESNISTTVETVKQLGAIYFADSDVAWALETYSPNSNESISVLRNIDSQVISYKIVHPYISNIDLYYENVNVFETEHGHFLSPEILDSTWYQEYQKSSRNPFIGYRIVEDTPYIYYIRRLNVLNYDSNNFVKIEISSDWLRNNLNVGYLEDGEKQLCLTAPDGTVILEYLDSDMSYLEMLASPSYELFEKEFSEDDILSGWKISIVYDSNLLQKGFGAKVFMIYGIFAAVLVCSFFMFYGLAHTIIARLERLASVMNRGANAEGNSLVKLDSDLGEDEIGKLASSYNRLVQRILDLNNENDLTNRELLDSNKKLTDSLEKVDLQGRQIHNLIYQDALTGLQNRLAITKYMDEIIRKAKNSNRIAVGFLDIDNFKLINDTYGHDVGDEILSFIGNRMNAISNEHISIGRFGGDEFIIVIRDFMHVEHLEKLLDTFKSVIKEPIVINQITHMITISMGVSIFNEHANTRHELLTLADIALYRAKELGRDRIILFEDEMYDKILDKSNQQELVRRAVKNCKFVMHYQPYFNAMTGNIVGCEALLRWQDDCELSMSPFQVIQIIEEMGMMTEFGMGIIEEASLFAKRINQDKKRIVSVAINISPSQLLGTNFPERLMQILEVNKVKPEWISLEITESVLMRSLAAGSDVIGSLREKGIEIHLDDFGTGYSSLGYFKELPISVLKIDRSFVEGICIKEYDAQLVETIILLAHNKKVTVIAEGIEELEQLKKLQELGCDMVQGYLYSRALAGEELQKKYEL